MLYDGLLLIALWMLGTALLLPLTGGQAITAGNLPYRAYLLAIAFAFFTGFWSRAGRTLGMQAWRLRLIAADGGAVGFRRAALRFVAAGVSWLPLGLGFLWSLFDRDRLAWHDRLSGTRLVVVPKGSA